MKNFLSFLSSMFYNSLETFMSATPIHARSRAWNDRFEEVQQKASE